MKRPFAAYQGDEPYVFVCYAHEDMDSVYPEIQRLHEGGVRIWYDEGISPGVRWTDELARHLGGASLVLFFCTNRSAKSKHCQDEVSFALEEQRPLVVIQDGAVDLPPGMRLQLRPQQSILKHELSAEQFAEKLTAAIGRNLTTGLQPAPAPKQSTRSLRRGLPRSLAVAGAVGGVVLVVLLFRMWPLQMSQPRALAPDYVPGSASTNVAYSVAVLPFRSSSSEPATATFAEGMADELVNELSGPMPAKVRRLYPTFVQGLRVASARSTLPYRNTNEDLASISRALGAGYLVEGSVQSAGERVRIAVRLIDVAADEPVWSHTYDAPMADPLQAQSNVAHQAARRIAMQVPDLHRQARGLFTNADAYSYWVRGNREQMDWIAGGDVDFSAMLANYEKTLELEPASWFYENTVSAYLALMDASMEPVHTVAPIDELLARGIASLHLKINPPPLSLLDAHLAHYSLHKLDYAGASQYLHDAFSDRPNDSLALFIQSVLLLHQERPDEALSSNRSSVDEIPTGTVAQVGLARLLRAIGQSLASVKAIDGALEFYPGELGKAQLLLEQAQAHLLLGQADRAATLVDQAWDLAGLNHPDFFPAALTATGRADRARVILRDLEAASHARRFSPLDMIEGYVALGDLDAAFRWIDRAVDARFEPVVRWMHLVTVSVAGVWPAALTKDPRWQQAYAKLPKVEGI